MSQGRRQTGLLAALAAAIALASAATATAAVPRPVDPGLRAVPVLEAVDVPTAVRFAPDGTIFVAEKDGRVLAFDGPGDAEPLVAADLRTEVHDFADRGLLGLALDPGFAVNRRLYLLYTRDAPPGGTAPTWGDRCPDPPGELSAGCVASGRLVRVTLGALGTAERIEPLIEDEWCQQFPSHSIGTVLFGPDGMLYAGAGDGANFTEADYGQFGGRGPTPPNPCGDPPTGRGTATTWPDGEGGALRAQDVRTPDDPAGLDGAIVRVDPKTGVAAPGGPFADSADPNARRIVAYGLRNPFRFAVRPGTDELWISDVGWGTRESVHRIADATDGVAENFGWPCYEGGTPAERSSYGGLTLCRSLASSDVTRPWFVYRHGEPVSADDDCSSASGSSLSGIAFGTEETYGARYRGALFFADYARNCLYMAPRGPDGAPDPARVSLFAAGNAGGGGPVDLQIGPDGSLYLVHFDWREPDATGIVRIEPTDGVPTARAAASPAYGPVPLRSTLSAAGSRDPEGQPLEHAWDLDGDGSYDDAAGETVEHVFERPGPVTVGLRVRDSSGLEAATTVVVQPGNTPPSLEVVAPARGTTFEVGQPIALEARADDEQDGPLPASGLSWAATIQHCTGTGCHSHPHQQWPGTASATLVAPAHELPSYVELRATARDSGGLTASARARLEPRTAALGVRTEPPGLQVRAGEADGPSPLDVRVMAGSTVSVRVADRQRLDGAEWLLAGWADGAAGPERLVAVRHDTVLTARFARPQAAPADAATPPAAPPAPEAEGRAPAPDESAPRLVLRAPRRVRLRRPLTVTLACPAERCAASVRASARIAGRTRRIARFERTLWPGRTVRRSLRLRPVRAAARRQLRRGRPVRARIVATARDAAGNRRRMSRTVRLVG